MLMYISLHTAYITKSWIFSAGQVFISQSNLIIREVLILTLFNAHCPKGIVNAIEQWRKVKQMQSMWLCIFLHMKRLDWIEGLCTQLKMAQIWQESQQADLIQICVLMLATFATKTLYLSFERKGAVLKHSSNKKCKVFRFLCHTYTL